MNAFSSFLGRMSAGRDCAAARGRAAEISAVSKARDRAGRSAHFAACRRAIGPVLFLNLVLAYTVGFVIGAVFLAFLFAPLSTPPQAVRWIARFYLLFYLPFGFAAHLWLRGHFTALSPLGRAVGRLRPLASPFRSLALLLVWIVRWTGRLLAALLVVGLGVFAGTVLWRALAMVF